MILYAFLENGQMEYAESIYKQYGFFTFQRKPLYKIKVTLKPKPSKWMKFFKFIKPEEKVSE